jgi:HK97 family phage major capsid protein
MRPAHLDAVRELAAELEQDWPAKLAELERSGVPLNAKHPLLATIEKTDGELKDLRTDAAAKHGKLQEAEAAVAAATERGETVGSDHEAFKALESAGAAYGETVDKITDRERVKGALVEQMAQAGIAAPGGDGAGDGDRSAYLDELRAIGLIRDTRARKTEGERIAESEEYKQALAEGVFKRRKVGDVALGQGLDREELKAALITGTDSGSAGAFVTPDRQGYYPLPLRPLNVLDLITIGQTDSDLVEYVRMLSLTNAAAETAEAITAAPIDGTTVTAVQGGRKPESGMAFDVVQEAVSTIAHWVPATKRSLSDAGQLRTIIDGSLRWGLGDRLERQIVAGNGVGENLLGILNQPGINSVAAADVPAGESPSIPQGTGLVGAFMAFILWLREGTQVLASDSHEDFFTRNLVAVLAEMRTAAGLPTPSAISEVALA